MRIPSQTTRFRSRTIGNGSKTTTRFQLSRGFQLLHELRQVSGQLHLPVRVLAAGGVFEAEFVRVESQSRRFALVLEQLAAWLLHVHLVAADRVAGFREVNANLVRAAGFEPA